jgi:hypothetical protein
MKKEMLTSRIHQKSRARDVLSLTRGNKTGFLLDWFQYYHNAMQQGYNNSQMIVTISLALRIYYM